MRAVWFGTFFLGIYPNTIIMNTCILVSFECLTSGEWYNKVRYTYMGNTMQLLKMYYLAQEFQIGLISEPALWLSGDLFLGQHVEDSEAASGLSREGCCVWWGILPWEKERGWQQCPILAFPVVEECLMIKGIFQPAWTTAKNWI